MRLAKSRERWKQNERTRTSEVEDNCEIRKTVVAAVHGDLVIQAYNTIVTRHIVYGWWMFVMKVIIIFFFGIVNVDFKNTF